MKQNEPHETFYHEKSYAVQTPDGALLTGTAGEIVAHLRARDWQPGESGPDGDRQWRETVAQRVHVQTGQTLSTESDLDFLRGLASAGLLALLEEDSGEEATEEHRGEGG